MACSRPLFGLSTKQLKACEALCVHRHEENAVALEKATVFLCGGINDCCSVGNATRLLDAIAAQEVVVVDEQEREERERRFKRLRAHCRDITQFIPISPSRSVPHTEVSESVEALFLLGVAAEMRGQEGASEAHTYYHRAAMHGHAHAMHNYARCLELGFGVEQDLKAAIGWYERSTERGCIFGEASKERALAWQRRPQRAPDRCTVENVLGADSAWRGNVPSLRALCKMTLVDEKSTRDLSSLPEEMQEELRKAIEEKLRRFSRSDGVSMHTAIACGNLELAHCAYHHWQRQKRNVEAQSILKLRSYDHGALEFACAAGNVMLVAWLVEVVGIPIRTCTFGVLIDAMYFEGQRPSLKRSPFRANRLFLYRYLMHRLACQPRELVDVTLPDNHRMYQWAPQTYRSNKLDRDFFRFLLEQGLRPSNYSSAISVAVKNRDKDALEMLAGLFSLRAINGAGVLMFTSQGNDEDVQFARFLIEQLNVSPHGMLCDRNLREFVRFGACDLIELARSISNGKEYATESAVCDTDRAPRLNPFPFDSEAFTKTGPYSEDPRHYSHGVECLVMRYAMQGSHSKVIDYALQNFRSLNLDSELFSTAIPSGSSAVLRRVLHHDPSLAQSTAVLNSVISNERMDLLDMLGLDLPDYVLRHATMAPTVREAPVTTLDLRALADASTLSAAVAARAEAVRQHDLWWAHWQYDAWGMSITSSFPVLQRALRAILVVELVCAVLCAPVPGCEDARDAFYHIAFLEWAYRTGQRDATDKDDDGRPRPINPQVFVDDDGCPMQSTWAAVFREQGTWWRNVCLGAVVGAVQSLSR